LFFEESTQCVVDLLGTLVKLFPGLIGILALLAAGSWRRRLSLRLVFVTTAPIKGRLWLAPSTVAGIGKQRTAGSPSKTGSFFVRLPVSGVVWRLKGRRRRIIAAITPRVVAGTWSCSAAPGIWGGGLVICREGR
jgi:hypothetical protein